MVKIPKETLQAILWDDHDIPDTNVIEDNIIDTSRWSEIHELVFKYKGVVYITDYSCGATESQDERPFEYSDDEVDCFEAELVNKPKWVIKK